MRKQHVLIIAVCFHGSADTARLLASLQTQTVDEWRLVIVDNSCSDDEASALAEIVGGEPRAEVILAPTNLGYFGAARFALQERDVSGVDFVIVSNVDVVPGSPQTLESLRALKIDPDVAVVAARIRSTRDGRDQNPHLRQRPTPSAQRRRRFLMCTPASAQIAIVVSHARRRLVRSKPQVAAQDIYAAHGSFVILTQWFFARGGTLDHPLFLFAEEITIAERVAAMGMRTAYRPEVEVLHIEHGQMGILRSRRVLTAMVDGAQYASDVISNRALGESEDGSRVETHRVDASAGPGAGR